MWEIEKNFKVKLGGNYYMNCQNLIVFNDKPLFTLKRRDSDGRLGIDFDVYDKDGSKIATVRNGKVVQGDPARFDISREATRHTVVDRETGHVVLQIDRAASEVELDVSVNMFLPNGELLMLTPTETRFRELKAGGNVLVGGKAGIAIDDRPT